MDALRIYPDDSEVGDFFVGLKISLCHTNH
jgi:hypothetical protein